MSEVSRNQMAGEMTVRTLIFHYQVSQEWVWVRMDLVDVRGYPKCWCNVYVHGN